MKRRDVIQKIIDKKKARTYLEIGIGGGKNFLRIKASKKTAVDPNFTFSRRRRIEWTFRNLSNVRAKLYECTSDRYFDLKKPIDRFDVVFVDGLHTYEQSLRDVINSLNYLNEAGVIIMHDCSPPDKSSAQPAESVKHASELNPSGCNSGWCGDVWKTICYLRSQRKDLNVFVLDFDYGMGIVTRGQAESHLSLSEEELDKMTYDDLEKDRKNLLNLKDIRYLSEFFESI
jgi:hypothetical protein